VPNAKSTTEIDVEIEAEGAGTASVDAGPPMSELEEQLAATNAMTETATRCNFSFTFIGASLSRV
jgi:hypothetical protein